MSNAGSSAGGSQPVDPELNDGGWRSLDPRAITADRIVAAIFSAVLGLGLLPFVLGFGLFGRLGLLQTLLLFFAWVVFVGSVAAWNWFWPPVRHRHTSYSLDSRGIRIRSGVWWRSEVSVPRSRVQHTDVSQGPIERSMELATLVIHTAGTQNASVSLGGLSHETALETRDWLLADGGPDVG